MTPAWESDMSTGIRVMLNALMGHETDAGALVGQTVAAAEFRDDALYVTLADGRRFRLYDDGQSCCENRYMVSDDDAADLIGGQITKIEVRDAPDVPDEHGENHEVQFVSVETTGAAWTARCHNEHNGYYGGFSLMIVPVSP